MKNTGVVRQVDELGRIVIPKEIRRNLRIREGDNLEFYIEDNAIVLKKYSQIESAERFAAALAESINASSDKKAIIADREKVIAVSGNFKANILGRKLNNDLDEILTSGTARSYSENDPLTVTDNLTLEEAAILKPIVVYGNVVGCIILSGEKITDNDKAIVEYTASFLSKYLDE